jgi:DNA-binding transcriptional LysR family regulator
MQLDWVDIHLFANIAETSSLKRGAELCHICPSAASRRIKNLETEVGASLLYRSTVGVRLTAAGHAFHRHLLILLHEMEELERDLSRYNSDRSHSNGLKGTIRITAGNALVSEFLTPVLRKYSAMYPNIAVEVRSQLCPEIVHDVSEGLADIGVYVGAPSVGETQVLRCGSYRMVLITSRKHALARQRRTRISFVDTLEFDHLTLAEKSASHSSMRRAAEVAGKTLRVHLQLPTFDDLCRMVIANLGIAVVPEFVIRHVAKSENLWVMSLSDEWAQCDIWVCARNGPLSRTVKEFVDLLIAHAAT